MELSSARKATWAFVLLFFGLLVFLFVPLPWKPKESPPEPVKHVESRLNAVGLRDNVDWENMPGEFAVFASTLEWNENKVRFAYWNPGTQSYSYFFEANRNGDAYRFRSISMKEAFDGREFDADGYETFSGTKGMEPVVSEFRSESKDHPFVFFRSALLVPGGHMDRGTRTALPPRPPLPINIETSPLNIPNPASPVAPAADPKQK